MLFKPLYNLKTRLCNSAAATQKKKKKKAHLLARGRLCIWLHFLFKTKPQDQRRLLNIDYVLWII